MSCVLFPSDDRNTYSERRSQQDPAALNNYLGALQTKYGIVSRGTPIVNQNTPTKVDGNDMFQDIPRAFLGKWTE